MTPREPQRNEPYAAHDRGWVELLQRWLEPDVAQLLAELYADPSPLSAVLSRHPKTLVHGDYRQANQAREAFANAPVALLDWQLRRLRHAHDRPESGFFNKSGGSRPRVKTPATRRAAALHRRCLEASG
ncbi:MAG: hypothetical protein R2838_00160 [Caldilineaceae bacterium]